MKSPMLGRSMVHGWEPSEPNQRNSTNSQIPIGIVWKRVGCVFGIEPNEHRIPRFQGKYSYHTHHPENPERPNSPNVLPMSQWCWCVGFFVSVNLSVSQGDWRERSDWDGILWTSLNQDGVAGFSRAMEVLVSILIGLLVVGCGTTSNTDTWTCNLIPKPASLQVDKPCKKQQAHS